MSCFYKVSIPKLSLLWLLSRLIELKYLSREKYSITRELITLRDTQSNNNSQELIWRWSNIYFAEFKPR